MHIVMFLPLIEEWLKNSRTECGVKNSKTGGKWVKLFVGVGGQYSIAYHAIIVHDLNLAFATYGVPQGSVLDPFYF